MRTREKDILRFWMCLPYDTRRIRLHDTRFLLSYTRQGSSQKLRMIDTDIRNYRQQRLDNIRTI